MSVVNKIRFLFYGAIILYLLAEFFIIDGPMRRWSMGDSFRLPSQDLAARVAGKSISNSQLDRAISERLWLQGKSKESATPEELKLVRFAALDELIEREILQLQAQAISPQLPVSEDEVNERLRRLLGRFESKGALETAMKSQGVATEQELRDRLTDQIKQEKLIELRIRPFIQVTDEEARKWFEENQPFISIPERISARHIFLPTLDHPSEAAKQKLAEALTILKSKKQDFASLAKEFSEDPATKDRGGDLGWMTRARLPDDFSNQVFPLEKNSPTLIQTQLGWHLIEVTERKFAEPRTFQQAESEIRSALEAIKRRQAVTDLRKQLRQSTSTKIKIF